jgi:phosphatidylglycerol:prolipoprotein diacylglycerol transferase
MGWIWDVWQHLPEKMDPVLFSIGGFKLQYYGLMYIVAFGLTYAMVLFRIRRESRFEVKKEQIQDLTTFMILGLIIGARLGYVVFYNLSYYLHHPLEIILPFTFSQGITFTGITGMSYHGGLIGLIVASTFYIRKQQLKLWDMADLYAPVGPLGYTFGRLGNFINGELYGRITDSPIGMYFPTAPNQELRHPSQLYEAFFEGVFLFVILWSLRKKQWPAGAMLSFYLIGYGVVRFTIEFFRQPDAHLGFVFLAFSMGQLLCFAMVASGILLYCYLYRQEHLHPTLP